MKQTHTTCTRPRPARMATLAAMTAMTVLGATSALAADTEPPPPPPPPRAAASPAAADSRYLAPAGPAMAGAREHLKASRWAAARAELERLNLVQDADWHNLMGYTLRRQASPDLAASRRHYDEALRINPDHLGALAYVGELALMQKDFAAAEAWRARLARACGIARPCEPLEELQRAIAAARR
jgi:hypothetical protein